MREAARIRVTNMVQAKKKALQKEKDSLDTADSSALLNSSGFTIAQPGSPGGMHSNRKTRHGRHLRQDQDNLESIEVHKRKRKAPADFDHESPGPGSRTLLGTNVSLWDKSRGFSDNEHENDWTIDKFFSSRELATCHKQAHSAVAEVWAGRRPNKATNGTAQLTNGAHHDEIGHKRGPRGNAASDDEEGQEDSNALVAPAMDRTGSHATRSTRNNQIDITLPRDSHEGLNNPDRIYGLAVVDAVGARQLKPSNRGDAEAPWTTGLSTQEISEDIAFFEQALAEDMY